MTHHLIDTVAECSSQSIDRTIFSILYHAQKSKRRHNMDFDLRLHRHLLASTSAVLQVDKLSRTTRPNGKFMRFLGYTDPEKKWICEEIVKVHA